jgi:hypothetical protein
MRDKPVIVTARKPSPRVPSKPASAPEPLARIVVAAKPGRRQRSREPSEEALADAAEWFKRQIKAP